MELVEITEAAEDGVRFAVEGYRGVAFRYAGLESAPDEDTEWSGYEVDTGRVLLVMVGDDRRHAVDPEDVSALGDDAYCHECGQIGCSHDGR